MLTMSGNVTDVKIPTIDVDLEFLDKSFKIKVPQDIDLDELYEIIEKFIFENPEISIDLKSLSKTILDTEYYNLILKQNQNGLDTKIENFEEIKIGIPLRLELESDDEKKRYYTRKHLKATFKHVQSMSITEFANLYKISNLPLFKQNLIAIENQFPIEINDDIIHLTRPFSKIEMKNFTNKLLDFME